MARQRSIFVLFPIALVVFSCLSGPRSVQTNPPVASEKKQLAGPGDGIDDTSEKNVDGTARPSLRHLRQRRLPAEDAPPRDHPRRKAA
ncbi:MAG: hypothetical protein ABJC07_05575 [Acidobacteriota bacterium]